MTEREDLLAMLLRASATTAQSNRRKERGRPKLTTMYDLEQTPSYKSAREVYERVLQDPVGYGAMSRALDAVSTESDIDLPTLKKRVQRHPEAKVFAQFMSDLNKPRALIEKIQREQEAQLNEIRKRLGNVADDVRDFLYRLPILEVLRLLRKQNINGYVPDDFCSVVRQAARSQASS